MTEAQAEGAAMVAMLLALPLVSWGSTEDLPALMGVGAVLLALGLAVLTVLRYVDLEEDT